jgi:hypothetical protein
VSRLENRAAEGVLPGGYAEDHCALDWQLMTAGIYAPVIAVGLFAAALTVGVAALNWAAIAIVFLAAAWWASGGGAWLRYVWPTAIRLDSSGVRIGGLGRADRGRTRARQAVVPRQYSQVFSCPWGGVLGIGVTTDRDVLRRLKRHAYRGRRPTPLGNLATPFMRAALVIWVDQNQAQLPEIRQASSAAWSSYTAPGFHQPVWAVPTRRPEDLAAALAVLPLPAGTVTNPAELTGPDSAVSDWSS